MGDLRIVKSLLQEATVTNDLAAKCLDIINQVVPSMNSEDSPEMTDPTILMEDLSSFFTQENNHIWLV